MKTLRILGFLVLVTLAISGSAFAQDNEVYYPDYGSGGGGSGSSFCHTCTGSAVYGYWCEDLYRATSPEAVSYWTYAGCSAYNALPPYYGPSFCEQWGACAVSLSDGGDDGIGSISLENQVDAFVDFFTRSGVMSEAKLQDFIAETDYGLNGLSYRDARRTRLTAYRAKFTELTGHTLRPGHIPTLPRKSAKAPAAKMASAGYDQKRVVSIYEWLDDTKNLSGAALKNYCTSVEISNNRTPIITR